MSLRILFADDSMTAQSMGKKILSEAGYEVVAVSNGAAAVKKIAEQKPDIIILDVYMPGYSGLEVCEKVRGSMDTLKTPVLLTVGKMEPYRAEDGNRVRADGVIVKPFEASDLLAIVKKLEERIKRESARVEQPVLAEQAHEAVAETVVDLQVEAAEPPSFTSTSHSTVEVPDHMAGNSAFGDLLTAEPLSSIPEMAVPPVASEMPPPPPPMPRNTTVPQYEVPVSWRDDEEVRAEAVAAPVMAAPEPELRAVPVEPAVAEPEPSPEPLPVPELAVPQVAMPEAASAEPAVFEPVAPEPEVSTVAAPEPLEPSSSESYPSFASARPLRIPMYQEPAPQPPASSYELMPTSAPAIGEIPIPREPELQETAEETTRKTVADVVEPGLMTTRQQFEWEHDHPSNEEATELAPVEEEPGIHLQDIPAEIALHAPPPPAAVIAPEPQSSSLPPTAPSVEAEEPKSEDDFEARVAAAMAAYKTAGPDAPLGGIREPEAESAGVEASAVAPAAEPPAVDYHPPAHYQPAVAAPEAEFDALAREHQGVAEPEAVPESESVAEPESRVPTFEYRPPVSRPEPAQPAAVRDFEPAAAHAPEEQPAGIASTIGEASAPELKSVAKAAAAAAGAGADHQAVSQAVHRVMERLKPELVEEILRELKSKE